MSGGGTTTSRCRPTSTTVTAIPDFEYAVIGLGGLGSAAAYHLARRGQSSVVGIEQFAIGHDRGASQDHSRIIRLSYHSPEYVELAKSAYETWAGVEKALDDQLILKTGGLDLWPPDASIPMSDYTAAMTARGVDFDLLNAAEVMRRWPQFRLSSDVVGLWQDAGGIVPAARCNAAHIRLARSHGATLLEKTPVQSISPREGAIEIAGDGLSLRCRKLVIAADAWTNDLLAHFDVHIPLTITQEQVTYFTPPDLQEFVPSRFPVWIWMDDPSFYGFPVYGEPAVKVGQDVGGREVSTATRTFEIDPAALERVTEFLNDRMPRAIGPALYTKTCLYTMPPDRDFVIDTVPGHPDVVVLQGAAHAYKFASLLGKIASELLIEGESEHHLTPFRFDRPALADPKWTENFLI